MFSNLLGRFLVATKVGLAVTAVAVGVMAINAVDAIYGDKIRKFLSD